MDKAAILKEFKHVTDSAAHIRDWTSRDNEHVREKASLDENNEYHLGSGRHNAERVAELLDKKPDEWSEDDYTFAGRVVNYAHRSAGIAEHHPHTEQGEVGDTGMTKNEIARRNWGLPAR